ncbi:hypothetical protein BB8028_0010g00320 [Beauveria bassiana]|uniref:Uncharacterized protein n=1 Tax=Beauveria bassiana TaxID=176275 RepID=A0A2S7YPM7_BEABA|nr:hypothetical protein BB8028_0010g00320 [Beauveria bassiana]
MSRRLEPRTFVVHRIPALKRTGRKTSLETVVMLDVTHRRRRRSLRLWRCYTRIRIFPKKVGCR